MTTKRAQNIGLNTAAMCFIASGLLIAGVLLFSHPAKPAEFDRCNPYYISIRDYRLWTKYAECANELHWQRYKSGRPQWWRPSKLVPILAPINPVDNTR